MPLTVLNVAYPLAPVSFDAAGGAEQVVAQLDAALVEAGHRSIVVACAGSTVRGELRATALPQGVWSNAGHATVHAEVRETVARVLATESIDVVHLHGIDFHAYIPPPGPPLLATLHLPPSWYPEYIVSLSRPRTYLHGVSRSQQHACPSGVRLLPPILNGVPVAALGAEPRRPGDFVISLGRICPEKGFHLALEAARRAGVPMLLAGQVYDYPAHLDYFHNEIEPRLDADRRFVGRVGFTDKCRLLASARALLVPSLVAETSSLAAMEAAACGTPVIAFAAGALPEIVEHGRTGFIVEDVDAMAAMIAMVDRIRSSDCRETARRRFDVAQTMSQYLERYAHLAGAESTPAETAHAA